MGGASADIIISELILLGVKRILRIGTVGSLQTKQVHIGDLVIASAAVRDDKASWDYIYPEFPATASLEYVIAALRAAKKGHQASQVHCGIVESKSSLYAREMGYSFLPENKSYVASLQKAGVLATEMECAQLFILAQIHNGLQNALASSKLQSIQVGAILAIISGDHPFSAKEKAVAAAIESDIELGLETTRQISYLDKLKRNLID
jgi:uridine phosphorylase